MLLAMSGPRGRDPVRAALIEAGADLFSQHGPANVSVRQVAKAAGVKAIGVSWGHHSVERLRAWAPVVDSVEELGRLLGV